MYPELQIGNLINDRYLLEAELGAGGMTIAYLAQDLLNSSKKVVLKFVNVEFSAHPQAEHAVQHEAEILKTLTHPYIVNFIAEDKFAEKNFIVLEYINGVALSQALKQPEIYLNEKKLRAAITKQLREVVNYLHEHDVVHADLKPSNIILLANGDIKLIDFSCARFYRNHPASFDPAVLNTYTPNYSSEAVKNGKPAMPEDDVYSLQKILRLLSYDMYL